MKNNLENIIEELKKLGISEDDIADFLNEYSDYILALSDKTYQVFITSHNEFYGYCNTANEARLMALDAYNAEGYLTAVEIFHKNKLFERWITYPYRVYPSMFVCNKDDRKYIFDINTGELVDVTDAPLYVLCSVPFYEEWKNDPDDEQWRIQYISKIRRRHEVRSYDKNCLIDYMASEFNSDDDEYKPPYLIIRNIHGIPKSYEKYEYDEETKSLKCTVEKDY